jgi:hypothetical protein
MRGTRCSVFIYQSPYCRINLEYIYNKKEKVSIKKRAHAIKNFARDDGKLAKKSKSYLSGGGDLNLTHSLNFPMQLHPAGLQHPLPHQFPQLFQIGCGGVARVQQEIAMQGRNLRPAQG